jgi:hypothetical protein
MKPPNGHGFWRKDLPLWLAISGVCLLGFAFFQLVLNGIFHYPWKLLGWCISATAAFWLAICALSLLIQVFFWLLCGTWRKVEPKPWKGGGQSM